VRAAGGQRERGARRVAVQASLGIEGVDQREEIVLVGAAAVEEDERACRRSNGRTFQRTQGQRRLRSRGFGSGVSSGSTCARRCSKSGGRISFSPRWAGASSVAKPGPSVAISKSTPLGSRK
jgi:hypothetical protein